MDLIEVEQRPETVDDFVRVYWGTVQKIATGLYNRHGVMDADDLSQAIWERVLPRIEKEYLGLGEDSVKRVLQRHGRDVISKESLDYMYHSGSYIYTPGEVREKLDSCAWSELEECPDVDARVDLRDAFNNLPPKQRIAVFKRYGLGETSGSMSESESRNERRGVDGITHYLNRGAQATSVRLDNEPELDEVEEFLLAGMDFRGPEWGTHDYGGEYWQ